jgi:hypothetical protein
VYSTFLGGGDYDEGLGIAVDRQGSAYLSGQTYSTDFPTYHPVQGFLKGSSDAFVAKMSLSGATLVYATYLGGSNEELSRVIAVDASGAAHISGVTTSGDFPLRFAFRSGMGGAEDSFAAKLDPSGMGLMYSTYLGGSGVEEAFGLAVDAEGSAWITGYTTSTDFPMASPLQPASGGNMDAFIARLSRAGTGLLFSTYLGGSAQEAGYGLALDEAGSLYVTGQSYSTNFPVQHPLQPASAGPSDTFVCKLAETAVRVPALNTWGILLMAAALGAAGLLLLRRSRPTL